MESLARTQESQESLPPQQSLALARALGLPPQQSLDWAMESLARTQESQQSLALALEAQQGLPPQQSLPAAGARIVSKGLPSVMCFLPAACIVIL
jgi:hypothetical protein